MRHRLSWAAPVLLIPAGCLTTRDLPPQTYNAELEYLKVINRTGPVQDSRLVLLLMNEYLNANQIEAGIEFFNEFLVTYHADLPPRQNALYLGALGVLRASYAQRIPLLKRIAWVDETIWMLEHAKKLTDSRDIMIRWITGIVYAQLPKRFYMKQKAYDDLEWVLANRNLLPEPGLLREVYYQLANLTFHDGRIDESNKNLALSGYKSLDREITTLTSFAVNGKTGHTFHPRAMREVVPKKIFALSGFEFTEYFFVISDDRKELIAIDAGTRPNSAKAAYEYLLSQVPNLPPLTTVFITHAHWDHLGGHTYLRKLNPDIRFYARDNYRNELNLALNNPVQFEYFFGSEFRTEFIAGFKPDVTIDRPTDVYVGGTHIRTIPIPGGETVDGMFIYLPRENALFVGDFIMPYIGAPFLEEGNIEGLLEAIETVVSLNPKYLLHGHEALTRNFGPASMLATLKIDLEWLYNETLKAIRSGISRPGIHDLNLIPPQLRSHPEVQFVYLILRENVINRVYDQNIGYWEGDLTGMDHLSMEDYGIMLDHYLGVSKNKLIDAIGKMIQSGDHELASKTAGWALKQYDSEALKELKRTALLKLKEKYQFTNPFKHIIYSEITGHETRQLDFYKPSDHNE